MGIGDQLHAHCLVQVCPHSLWHNFAHCGKLHLATTSRYIYIAHGHTLCHQKQQRGRPMGIGDQLHGHCIVGMFHHSQGFLSLCHWTQHRGGAMETLFQSERPCCNIKSQSASDKFDEILCETKVHMRKYENL